MNPTLVAVLSAAAVAVLVAGVGLVLIRRGSRPEPTTGDEDLVSSADRLADVHVSPFGANDPIPPGERVPQISTTAERLTGGELIQPEAPVWAAGSHSDAPAPVPATDSVEPMFPGRPVPEPEPEPIPEPTPDPPLAAEPPLDPEPAPEPEPSHEPDPVADPVPEPVPAAERVYDPDAVLAELRSGSEENPAEPQPTPAPGFEPIPAPQPISQHEPIWEPEPIPEPVQEPDPTGGQAPQPPPEPSPDQRGVPAPVPSEYPPKVVHVSALPAEIAGGIETEWCLLTPVEALGSWPSSDRRTKPAPLVPARSARTSVPATSHLPPEPPPPEVQRAEPAPPEPPPPESPVTDREPPAAPEGGVQLPDSLLADLLGGDGRTEA